MLKKTLTNDKVIDIFVEFVDENKTCSKCYNEMQHSVNGTLLDGCSKYHNNFNKICYDCDEIKS
jgi:hypothetical protein